MSIDTARYKVSEGIRAFGIDLQWSYGSGCGEIYPGPERTLYIIKNNTIEAISPPIEISNQMWLEGGFGYICHPINYGYEIMHHSTTRLSMEGTKSNGFYDIKLTTKEWKNKELETKSNNTKIITCKGESISILIKYNGKSYEATQKDQDKVSDFIGKRSSDKTCKF